MMTHTPSLIEKSLSSSPPNSPSKTPSTKETSSTFGTTSSFFESKPHSSPLSSRNTPSPQSNNPFLNDPLDAPTRPSNPLPLQSYPSLDITLSLSHVTPLDHMFETPSPPPLSPPPQPLLMSHPIYFNVFDYHGAHCLSYLTTLDMTFDETPLPSKTSPLVDDDLDEVEAIKVTKKKHLENDIEDETLEVDEIVNIKESKNHPLENVIGNLNQRTLRSQAQNQSNLFCFISTIEPKNVNEALKDKRWIIEMQEELNQFIANDVWGLVPHPKSTTIIRTKWVYRNKLDENSVISHNKDRLDLIRISFGVLKEFHMDDS
ncbi:hypothetical protein Tco_0902230 [Tanacetum coccineum]